MIKKGKKQTLKEKNDESRKMAEEERKRNPITYCLKHQRYHNKISGCVDCREKRPGYGVLKKVPLKIVKKIEKEMTKAPRKSNQDYDEYYGIKKKEKKNDTK